MAERVAIVGGREASEETFERVRAYVRALPDDAVVVTGGALGVEIEAKREACACGLAWTEIRMRSEDGIVILEERSDRAPEWEHHSTLGRIELRDALVHRNDAIAVECTRLVAFMQGSRGGAADAVAKAKRLGRPVEVVRG